MKFDDTEKVENKKLTKTLPKEVAEMLDRCVEMVKYQDKLEVDIRIQGRKEGFTDEQITQMMNEALEKKERSL